MKDGDGTATSVNKENNLEDGEGRATSVLGNDLEEGVGTAPSVNKENDSSLGSTESSNNTSNQIGKIVPQGKFRGKELLLKDYSIKKQEQSEKSRKTSTYCKEQGW
jgi:hypothetical protein